MNNLLINKDNQLHISKLNGKLEGFYAIGTNTTTNNFCIKSNNPQSKLKIDKSKIKNNMHLKNYIKICNGNKQTTFALWTKRITILIIIKNLRI